MLMNSVNICLLTFQLRRHLRLATFVRHNIPYNFSFGAKTISNIVFDSEFNDFLWLGQNFQTILLLKNIVIKTCTAVSFQQL